MALADLYVDPMTKSVTTASGNSVEFFIDMQPATQAEVEMLRTTDIQTIEYLEAPSDPRFHGARYAVNYVLVKYDYGGYTSLSGQQPFSYRIMVIIARIHGLPPGRCYMILAVDSGMRAILISDATT